MSSKNTRVQIKVIELLGVIGNKRAVPHLLKFMWVKNTAVVKAAEGAYFQITKKRFRPVVIKQI